MTSADPRVAPLIDHRFGEFVTGGSFDSASAHLQVFLAANAARVADPDASRSLKTGPRQPCRRT